MSRVVTFGKSGECDGSHTLTRRVIGRKTLSDIELGDDAKPAWSHSALMVLEEEGEEVKTLRDNMPFCRPGWGEFRVYFIDCARSPALKIRFVANQY